MSIKRFLFLLHRWFGIAMCVLFALWFASGIVMMYVEYPELTEAERLAALPPLDPERIAVTPDAALAAAGARSPSELSLSAVGMRPAYRVADARGAVTVVFADTGEVFGGTTEQSALEAVAASGLAQRGAAPAYDAAVDMDQWTVSSVLDAHRPLHRVEVGDAAGTVAYVSDRTGQIVRDATRRERFWNWLGSTIHWIYPMQLRRHGELWANLIIGLSLAGIVSVVTGAVIGFMRLRVRRRYRGGSASPYRGYAKWHHVLGLVGLVFLGTFVFSGLMSMGPWGIFESASPAAPQLARYTGGPALGIEAFPRPVLGELGQGIKELRWQRIGGEGHLVVSGSSDDRRVSFDGRTAEVSPRRLVDRIVARQGAFLPDADVVSAERLDAHDDHYYSRHNRYRPLPAYRVGFDDPESTWFHIDLMTGEVVSRYTSRDRLGRWLYNGLHSLDFSFLITRGLLWDSIVIGLSILGFVFSVTSVVLGWRRLT